MQDTILALLRLFDGRVADAETHGWVSALASERGRWPEAHDLFRRVRRRSLDTAGEARNGGQYAFEEICLKSLFNETGTTRPFDPGSSFSVARFAVRLARRVGVPEADVLDIVAAHACPETARYLQVFEARFTPSGTSPSPAVFPDPHLFPTSHPGPYERGMGDRIVALLDLFQAFAPDAASNAAVRHLAGTPDRWSAGHAYFDVLHDRLLAAMRARDRPRYLQLDFERSCLQALYNATSPPHPFAPGTPFWVACAAVRFARVIGVPDAALLTSLAPEARD